MPSDVVFALMLFASHAIVAVIGYAAGEAVGRITARNEAFQGHAERLEERLEDFEEGLDVE